MRKLIEAGLDNPLAMVLGMGAIVLLGVYAALHMPTDLFPKLDVPVVNIITHYSGAAPEAVELLISRPLEDEMRRIQGAKRIASTSDQGISQVTVEFAWGTAIGDARRIVQAGLGRVKNFLPAGVDPRIESIGTTLQEVAGYVVYGGSDPVALANAVRSDLSNRLMAVDGVSSVEVLGGERRAFWVKVKPEVLNRLQLTVKDVIQALRRNNQTAVPGYLERSSREYLLRADARLRSIDDVRSIPVSVDGDRFLSLGSIASVSEGWVPRHYVIRGDGSPAVAFAVRKQPRASTIRVVREVDQAIADSRGLLPPGTQVRKYYDQSEIIAEARNAILRNLLVGALLAVLILYLFLGAWGPTAIVAVTIPITLLATLALMHLLDLGLNMITLSALALAVGMVVDDSIVVAENVIRRRQLGQSGREASIDGTLEIAGADASGTFTTVAAFLPLVLITGLAAIFLKPFGLTISLSLLTSLVLSLMVIPIVLSRTSLGALRRGFAGRRLLHLLEKALQATLRFCFRRKALILGLGIVSLGSAGVAAIRGGANLLPPIDEGAILIEYIMPPGTSLSESDRIGMKLDRIALADPDAATVYRRTGSPERGYQLEGVNRGEITIKLKPRERRERSVAQIMERLKRAYSKIGGVVFLFHQPTQEKIDESLSGLPALFGVTIYGTDSDTLVSLADRVEGILRKDRAVRNIVNNARVKAPEVLVRLNYAKLTQYEVSADDVLMTLRAARLGAEATRIVRQREEVRVLVEVDAEEAREVDSIGQLEVATGQGGVIPLERVADIQVVHSPASITRLNGRREITLLAEVEGSIPALVSRMRGRFQTIEWPEGYRVEFTGQYKVLGQTLREMVLVLAAALFMIYLILAMQFRSLLHPLIILFTVPFSLTGALVALFVTRQGFDVSVGVGVVTLVGISVNNAIVLLDYTHKRVLAGQSMRDALLSAASVRLRPILMTALTTIFALVPVAIGSAAGSKIFQPFAVTVIGGLISGTVATLILVPTIGTTMPFRPRTVPPESSPVGSSGGG